MNVILRWMLETWNIFGNVVHDISASSGKIRQIIDHELKSVIYKRTHVPIYSYKGKAPFSNATACNNQLEKAQSHHPSRGLILTLTPSLGLVVIPPLIFIFDG